MSPKLNSAICLLAWASPAWAQSVVLLPSKTNTLIQVTSASVQQLSNGQGDIYVGRTNQDGQGPATISIRRGLVAFDVADNVPAGATITGVTLTVDDVRELNGSQTITLSRMLRDWGQGASYFDGGQGAPAANGDATWYYTFYNAADPAASPTWTAPGGLAGVDFSATISAAALDPATGVANQSLSWSSTANLGMLTDVQQWLDNPATNFGWIVLGNESAGQTAKRFGGQNATSPETPPQLAVQYSEPTWIWTGNAGNAAWTSSGNWSSSAGTPGGNAAIVLGSSAAISATVDLLAAAPRVSQLTFDANHTVTMTSTAPGGGRLTLDNGSNPVAVVVSSSGSVIDNTIVVGLDSDLGVTIGGSGDSLTIAGSIVDGDAAHGIQMDGAGTLILSGDNTYTGPTSVEAGTLLLTASDALPDGTSLTVGAGGTLIFDPPAVAASADSSESTSSTAASAVPEPTMPTLLAAGALAAGIVWFLPRKATRV
jgi:autotransporter-associated beta strand protein